MTRFNSLSLYLGAFLWIGHSFRHLYELIAGDVVALWRSLR